MLKCVAVLQCAAVCCSMLRRVAVCWYGVTCSSVLQCCSVLWRVAVCCSVFQMDGNEGTMGWLRIVGSLKL